MAEVTNELIYEVLKGIQQDVGQVKSDVRDVKAELGAVRTYMLAIQQDIHNLYTEVAGVAVRLDRVERRLNLHEPAE